jgi:hypothetical protein
MFYRISHRIGPRLLLFGGARSGSRSLRLERKGFDAFIWLGAWSIRKEHNSRMHNREVSGIHLGYLYIEKNEDPQFQAR